MKHEIKDIRVYKAVSQISKPIADATHTISKIAFYIVEVTTGRESRDKAICCLSIILRCN